MRKYHKIYSPFERHIAGPLRNKLDDTRWTMPEFELLADLPWTWTEKVDGTNIRVGWDGHKVEFGGRTDNAQIPAPLVAKLRTLFPEEIFENQFKDTAVTLFGEGHGPKIQRDGHLYGCEVDFSLFDVFIENTGVWLTLPDVRAVAEQMGLRSVPQVPHYTLYGAIEAVRDGFYSHYAFPKNVFFAEGLVGRAPMDLRTRRGERIIVKVKHVDFHIA